LAAGYALHVGLDGYDADAIGLPRTPPATGAVHAASAMSAITSGRGFRDVVTLTDSHATRARVFHEFDRLTASLSPGDLFVFSLAGHAQPYTRGGQTLRQEFLLYDYAWRGDEIVERLASIASTVRVLVVLESCYADALIAPGPLKRIVDADILAFAACNDIARAVAAAGGNGLPPFTAALCKSVDLASDYSDLIDRIKAQGLVPEPLMNRKLLKPASTFPEQAPFSI
jgi:hypothetical protein